MKETPLKVDLSLVDDQVKFECSAEGKAPVIADYFFDKHEEQTGSRSEAEDYNGYTSLELFLISAASCLASTVKLMVAGRLKKRITALGAAASGVRRESHPTFFDTLTIELKVESPDLQEEELGEVIKLAEEKICPVLCMIKDEVKVKILTTLSQPVNTK